MAEEKDLEKREEMLPEEVEPYEDYTQTVVTRRYQRKHGFPVGRKAEVWVGKPPEGSTAEKGVYAMGTSDVVQEVGAALEGGYEYIGLTPQQMSPERESEVMSEEMGKLLRSTERKRPEVLPKLYRGPLKEIGDRLRQKFPMLPPSPAEVGDQMAKGIEASINVDEALRGFKPTKYEKEGGD